EALWASFQSDHEAWTVGAADLISTISAQAAAGQVDTETALASYRVVNDAFEQFRTNIDQLSAEVYEPVLAAFHDELAGTSKTADTTLYTALALSLLLGGGLA